MDSIGRSASLGKNALICGGAGDASEVPIGNPFKDLHCMAQEMYGSVVGAFTHIGPSLPDLHSDTGHPGLGWLVFCDHPIAVLHFLDDCQYFGYSDWQDGSRDRFRAGNWWMWELFIGDLREVVTPSLEDDWRVNEELMVCVLDVHHLDNGLGGIVARAGKAIDLVYPFQHI